MGNDTNDFPLGAKKRRGRPCRMAYTLNNDQPVRCTIVSDQPFFYMDMDIPFEDDDILHNEAYEELDFDLNLLKSKIESYDRLSLDFAQSSDQRLQDFVMDRSFICAPAEDKASYSIEELREALETSRFAAALLEFAQEYDVSLTYSAQVMNSLYDRKDSCIYINPALSQADQILLACMELRRHWQHRQGTLVDPLTFHPDQAVLVYRAQNADLASNMIRMAWELQLAGHKDVWERVENSSFADLGRALARESHLDFRTLNSGQATAAVFETWFLSERCRAADRTIIQRMLADYQGYVFDSEQASKMVSADLIASLGSVPFGKNYLAQYAHMILSDPIFTDVRDRSNANFLWFIKFEQSFREAEQELQSDDVIYSQGIPLGQITKTLEDISDEEHRGSPGQVVDHPRSGQFFESGSAILEGDAQKPNVIYVQFGTGDFLTSS